MEIARIAIRGELWYGYRDKCTAASYVWR